MSNGHCSAARLRVTTNTSSCSYRKGGFCRSPFTSHSLPFLSPQPAATLADCVAATFQAEHDNALAYDFPMFSLPVSADAVIAALSSPAESALTRSAPCPSNPCPAGPLVGPALRF